MPNKTIHELYEEIKGTKSKSKDYEDFLKPMTLLDQEMSALMKADENGWKLLDKERYDSLLRKYRVAGNNLEVYLSDTKDTTDPDELALREKVKMLGDLMAADTNALRHYGSQPQRELKSLPTILEEARVPVMDQGSKKIKSVGGAQSSRIPMTIIGPDGKPLAGMFTKADVFDPIGMCNKAAAAAAAKAVTQEGADLIRNFMTAYKAYYTAHPDPKKPVGNDPDMAYFCLKDLRKPGSSTSNFTIIADRFAEELARVSGKNLEEIYDLCGRNALKKFCSEMHSNKVFDIYIKAREVKMEPGARVDRKNAGMSLVAERLGMPDIVCHSRPMKLKGPDGKIVDGTFMAFAKGVDPGKPGHEGFKLDSDSLKNTDGRGLEAIADLQVLDYICGNVDRHGYNVFYITDEDGKLIGVQGIDNDSSLGKIVPQKWDDKVRRVPTPSTMGVISKKTAEKIMKTSPAELAFILRGTVDEPSIDAACHRLYVMQKMIEKSRENLDPQKQDIRYPYLRELDTKGFAKVDLKKLTEKKADNHFRELTEVVKGISGRANRANETDPPELIGSTNRATEAGVTGQILKAKALSKKLSDCTSFWRGSSSQNYLDLEKAVKDYRELQEKLQLRMKQMKQKAAKGDGSPETLFGQYVTAFDMDKMRLSLKNIQAAADKYATNKLAELQAAGKTLDDDKYIKDRIEAAQEISRFAAEGQKASPEEKEALASNDRRAMEQHARIQTAAERKKENDDRILNRKPDDLNNILQP